MVQLKFCFVKNIEEIITDKSIDLITICSPNETHYNYAKLALLAGKNVMVIDATKNVVHTEDKKLVLLQGLDDFIIVDTKDVLLICKKEKEQEIKEYVAEVKRNMGDKYL